MRIDSARTMALHFLPTRQGRRHRTTRPKKRFSVTRNSPILYLCLAGFGDTGDDGRQLTAKAGTCRTSSAMERLAFPQDAGCPPRPCGLGLAGKDQERWAAQQSYIFRAAGKRPFPSVEILGPVSSYKIERMRSEMV